MVEQNPKSKSIPPHVKAIAGSIGGMVEACCLQPIDVIKTRLQLDRSGSYRGIIHSGATIIQTEGVRALWKGLTPFATHLTLKYALRMSSNAVLQTTFRDPRTGELSHGARVLAGFGAGVIETLVIVTPFESMTSGFLAGVAGPVCTGPFDVVKTRLMAQSRSRGEVKYKGMVHAIMTIYKEERLRALWKGLLPRLMRIPPGQAIM